MRYRVQKQKPDEVPFLTEIDRGIYLFDRKTYPFCEPTNQQLVFSV